MLKIWGLREVLVFKQLDIDVCLPPYLKINMTVWLKRQIPDFDISCQQ